MPGVKGLIAKERNNLRNVTIHRYVQSTSTTGSNLASVTSAEVTSRVAKTIHRLLA